MRKKVFFIFLLFACLPISVNSEITLNNGNEIELSNENKYIIKWEDGSLLDKNVFHDIKTLNIAEEETAIFTGNYNLQNIICGINGGFQSGIFGTIQTQGTDATLILLNPAGFIFGENAKIDMSGSFYVSTADYLKMSDGTKIDLDSFSDGEILTSAQPAAFGFLDETISSISIGSPDADIQNNLISNAARVAFVGGDIYINNTNIKITEPENSEEISYDGRLQLVSLASKGEYFFDDYKAEEFSNKGNLNIVNSSIDVSNLNNANLHIIGNDIFVDNSSLLAQIKNEAGGMITIYGNSITFENGSKIQASTFGTGNACNINIIAENDVSFISDSEPVFIESETHDSGNAGNINIQGKNITFQNAHITGVIRGSGNGGNVTFSADENVNFIGIADKGKNTFIELNSLTPKTTGDSGSVNINAKNDILFENGASINVNSDGYGKGGDVYLTAKEGSIIFRGEVGPGRHVRVSRIGTSTTNIEDKNDEVGVISLIAGTSIEFSDGAVIKGESSTISLESRTISFSGTSSDGEPTCIKISNEISLEDTEDIPDDKIGKLEIKADDIYFSDGAFIAAYTDGGYGAKVHLTANNKIVFSGESISEKSSPFLEFIGKEDKLSCIFAAAVLQSEGGNGASINIQAKELVLEKGAYLSTKSVSNGDGGDINISNTGKIILTGVDRFNNPSYISSSVIVKAGASNSENGYGGDISINANVLELQDGASINSSTNNFALESTCEDGGDISIETVSLKLQDGSSINSNARVEADNSKVGNGGNIIIRTDFLELNNGSSINSSSYVSGTGSTGGNAAIIDIEAQNTIKLSDAKILTDAKVEEGAKQIRSNDAQGGGGTISINSGNTLNIINSVISTSVIEGEGNGGDINLQSNIITLLNGSIVKANAKTGDGGAVYIKAESFFRSLDSITEATSERGNNGTVKVEAPKIEIYKDITALSSGFLDNKKFERTICADKTGENISNLVINCREGMATSLEDLMHSPPCLRWFKDNSSQKDIAETKKYNLLKQGLSYYDHGEVNMAVNEWKRLLKQISMEKNPGLYLHIIEHLANAYQFMGLHQRAISLYQESLPVLTDKKLFEKAPKQEILFYSFFGDLYLTMGKIIKAKKFFYTAFEKSKKIKDPFALAYFLNNYANFQIIINDLENGVHCYNEALKNLDNLPQYSELKSKILLNKTFVISVYGTYEKIIQAFNKTKTHIQAMEDSRTKSLDLISLYLTFKNIEISFPNEKKDFFDTAYELLNHAQHISSNINDNLTLSISKGYKGQLFEKINEIPKAIKQTREAVFFASQESHNEVLYLLEWQLAKLFKLIKDEEKSISLYKDAIKTLSNIRLEFFKGNRIYANVFNEKVRPVYMELAEIYLNKADSLKDPMEIEKTLNNTMELMENLKSMELQDYFEDECIMTKENKNIKINLKDKISKNTAIINPIILKNRLAVLAAFSDGIKHFNISIDYHQLNDIIKKFYDLLNSRISNKYLKLAQNLYNLIIKPLENDLKKRNIKTLLIAPDGIFRILHFSALHDGEDFLVQKYSLTTIPVVSSVDSISMKSIKRYKDNDSLNCGLSIATQGFSSLKNVEKEIEFIGYNLQQRDLLMNQTYTVSNFENFLKKKNYDLVHMATHAYFGDSARNTFLLTVDGRINMNLLEKIMSSNKYNGHKIDLLTLSACQTASGDEREALGLAGVAVKAGVRSVIATLWQVDDEATALAMKDLYSQFNNHDLTKAQALQNVQKRLILQSKYRHPIYWAPFILIGNYN